MPTPDEPRRTLGSTGERAAAAYLVRHGYTIIARNWRCRSGEIDLIARQGDQLVFVEVRTRRAALAGLAEESITPTKQARLRTLAYTYLQEHAHDGDGANPAIEWRIDVIAVQMGRRGRVVALNHIPAAIAEEA
jgi:putative endonuclease